MEAVLLMNYLVHGASKEAFERPLEPDMHMLWPCIYAGLNFLAASVDVAQPQTKTHPGCPISLQFT